MTTVLDRVTDVQDQVLAAIGGVKEPVTDAVAVVVTYVVDKAPQIPTVPFADQIPSPKELIDNQSKFASKLVTTNKSVASVAAAVAPLTDQLLDRKTARSTTKKTVA